MRHLEINQILQCINNLNKPFQGVGVSTTDYSDGIIHGHPPGGVIIMWDVKLESYVKPLDLNLDWCVLYCIDSTFALRSCVYTQASLVPLPHRVPP